MTNYRILSESCLYAFLKKEWNNNLHQKIKFWYLSEERTMYYGYGVALI